MTYTYSEGLFLGQRYFDSHSELTYHYPFGFGLSYSSFEFSDLALTMNDNGLTVKFKVKNAGKYDGKVVPMVFLKFPLDNYPEKVLKGFDKKEIKSGQSDSFEIASIYGSDTVNKDKGNIMNVNTLFPSKTESTGEVKGGVVLLKLNKKQGQNSNTLNLKVS